VTKSKCPNFHPLDDGRTLCQVESGIGFHLAELGNDAALHIVFQLVEVSAGQEHLGFRPDQRQTGAGAIIEPGA